MPAEYTTAFVKARDRLRGHRSHHESDALGMKIYWQPMGYTTRSKAVDMIAQGRVSDAMLYLFYSLSEDEDGDLMFTTQADMEAIRDGCADQELLEEVILIGKLMLDNDFVTDETVAAAKKKSSKTTSSTS